MIPSDNEQEETEITEASEANEAARRETALTQLQRAKDALGLAEYYAWATPAAVLPIQNARQAVICAENRIAGLSDSAPPREPLLEALKAAESTLANIQADISSGRLFSKDAVANLGKARSSALQVIAKAEGRAA